MSSHQGFQALATRLINQHGRNVVLKTQSKSGSSWKPVLSDTDQPTKAVQTRQNRSEIASEIIEETDIVFIVDSVVVPDVSMRLVDDQDYSIVAVSEVNPGDQSIMFRVVCRG